MKQHQPFLLWTVLYTSLNDWFQLFVSFFRSIRSIAVNNSELLIGQRFSALMIGIGFGIDGRLPNSIYFPFRHLGMLHIWSASAYNISLFSNISEWAIAPLARITNFFNYQVRTAFALLSIITFWFLSTQTVSMQRAVLMSAFFLFTRRVLCRQISSTRSLVYAVGLLLVTNPDLVESWSLRFSAAASWGVTTLLPVFQSMLFQPRRCKRLSNLSKMAKTLFRFLMNLANFFMKNLLLFFSVQLALLPFLGEFGSSLTLISVLSNVLVASLTTMLMLLSFLWFVWSLIIGQVAQIYQGHTYIVSFVSYVKAISRVATLPFNGFIQLVSYLSNLNSAGVVIPHFSVSATICWFILLALIGYLYRSNKTRSAVQSLKADQFSQYFLIST